MVLLNTYNIDGSTAKYDVDHDTVNIHLNDKPDWLKEINPAAMVPILEVTSDSTSTRFITESATINEFIIATFAPAEDKATTTKDDQNALATFFMENTVNLWYQVIYYKVDAKKDELVASFDEFAAKLEGDFLGGSDIGVADYNIWVSSPISSEAHYVR